jgi:hypothetical protein
MEKGEIITLSNGEKATIIVGNESNNFNNIYVVKLENGEHRVVDRVTLLLQPQTGLNCYTKREKSDGKRNECEF